MPEPSKESAQRTVWYLPLVLALAFSIFAASGIANYQLNPLAYNRSEIHDAALALSSGQHLALYDTSINWRALRREQISTMQSTPEVLVFGGSRWWEAHSELVPGVGFFNAWVSNDQAEDALALAYLLDEANRLPETLVLSLRFISFQPLSQREPAEWQEWAEEYRIMASRLGIDPHSYLDTIPVRNLSGMFYGPGVYDKMRQISDVADEPGPTTDLQRPKLEILAADGSIHWSERSLARFTKEFVDKAVDRELKRVGNSAPEIDRSLVEAMAKAIEFLQHRGVRVVLAQTPYHPHFYAEVQQRPFGAMLNNLQSIADEMHQRFGVISVGSFDPAELGCVAEQFRDHIHADDQCVGNVLWQVPGLERTGAAS